jgi:hypothetical protein
MFGFTIFIIVVLLSIVIVHAPTTLVPIKSTVDPFMPLDINNTHIYPNHAMHVVVKSSSFGRMNYYHPVAKPAIVRSVKRLAKVRRLARLARVHRADRMSTSLQQDNSPSNDHHKNKVVIPVIFTDCICKYYLFTGSIENGSQQESPSFACNKNCPVVPSLHQHAIFSPADIIATSNMIAMYRGLFTGRPPGLALVMIRQFVFWHINISNKHHALEQQDGLTSRQEFYYIFYPVSLEPKSHNQVVSLHINIHLVVSKTLRQQQRQRDSYSSSERGVTTLAKEFEFEFTFEFESRFGHHLSEVISIAMRA